MTHELLSCWRAFKPIGLDRVLEVDADSIACLIDRLRTPTGYGWKDYVADPLTGAGGDTRLHLSLMPIPFLGNLETARVVVLYQNPGLSSTDYFGEFEVQGFSDRLLANLRGELAETEYPFLFLDPSISWHGGFKWWNDKLRGVIHALAQRSNMSYSNARRLLAKHLAAIELVPYHSQSFGLPGQWVKQLRSAKLARDYVHGPLLMRARKGATRIIVTRQVDAWGLKRELPFVEVYDPSHARRGSLSTDSLGGKVILAALESSLK